MSDEPNIPGVPDGMRIVRVREINTQYGDPYFEAILERIPKPKKRVLVAEWDLEEGDTELRGLQRAADRTRIEEREEA